ncbi:microsomal triglyceride transfer protein large subunit-like, partial [Ceratina calcarata]|uniref:Microsomal triglyceride transfer protein large subunit-like n=1 Tax=Ceratina calcarata TaxID=156304 RepID=A0AAJ7JG42_9HYME
FSQLLQPQLWIKSRRAPEPKGFVEHSSRIDILSQKPLFILWKNGEVISVFMDPSETVSSANFKRGLASLLQYRVFDSDVWERDASGFCNVTYHSLGPKTIKKEKIHCEKNGLPPVKRHPNPLFGVKVAGSHVSTYELTQELVPKIVVEEERHKMTLTARP